MLAKKYRLPVQFFYAKRGKVVKNNFFLIKSFDSKEAFSRFGVVVGSKVSPKATKRNQVKRTIYELVRREGRHEIPGKNVIITVFPEVKTLSKKELEAALKEIL